MMPKKKLIEVALPLEAINKAAAREKSIRHGHPTTRNRRGINKTDWIQIDRKLYDSCLDRRDYRPPGKKTK